MMMIMMMIMMLMMILSHCSDPWETENLYKHEELSQV